MHFALDTANLHPTTEACLKSLQRLQQRNDFRNVLEIGCGNGILALTAAHVWPHAHVLAADISPKAVDDTKRRTAEYRLEHRIHAVHSDGFLHPETRNRAPYDLMICNLLADTLLRLTRDIYHHMENNGYLLISGILAWRSEEIETAFMGLGAEIIERNEFLSWASYLLHKPIVTKA